MCTSRKTERILQTLESIFLKAATLATTVVRADEALRAVEALDEHTMPVKALCNSARHHLFRGEYELARDAAIALTELRHNDEVRVMHGWFCGVCTDAKNHETEVRGLVAMT